MNEAQLIALIDRLTLGYECAQFRQAIAEHARTVGEAREFIAANYPPDQQKYLLAAVFVVAPEFLAQAGTRPLAEAYQQLIQKALRTEDGILYAVDQVEQERTPSHPQLARHVAWARTFLTPPPSQSKVASSIQSTLSPPPSLARARR